MPDLRALRAYEKRLLRQEAQLERELMETYIEYRRTLLDILDVSVAALVARIPAQSAMTRIEIQRQIRSALAQVSDQAAEFAIQEISTINRLVGDDEDASPPDALIAQTAAAREKQREAMVTQSLAPFDTVAALLLATAAAAAATAASAELLRARLFAANIAGRASVWRGGQPRIAQAATEGVWGAANGSRQIVYQAAQTQYTKTYKKQAIATIDRRTTRCCLAVHSQIRELHEPFDLTGTPRFADQMDAPPFHNRCRTSVVAYHESMEKVGPTTRDLHAAAQAEIQARLMGGTTQTHRSQTALGELE